VETDTKWLIGLSLTLILASAGFLIAALSNLHGRINRLREEMSKDFVRRADLDSHLSRLDQNVNEFRRELHGIDEKLQMNFKELISMMNKR
jgi:predicted nuclease with TOPRIM domain